MSEIKGWKCDECGELRKESNHWWMLNQKAQDIPVFVISAFDEADSRAWMFHFCGHDHLFKKLSRLMHENS